MTPSETVILTRYVTACCPQQVMDDYTPDAWYDLLGDLPLTDCKTAVAAVARRQPFVAPAEIRAEVQHIRNQRWDSVEIPPPPPELLDDTTAWCAALRAANTAAADGRDPAAAMKAIARQTRRELPEASRD